MKTWAVFSGELFNDPMSIDFLSVARVDALLVAVGHDDDNAHVVQLMAGISGKFGDTFAEIGVFQIS
jgi:hypothetical protein